jgi:hypothetical protein
MRQGALTSLIVAMALAGCGTSTTPAASGIASPATGTTSPATGSQGEHKPTCYPVILTENSGDGPTYHVRICDALRRPRPGHAWELIVDGGPLGNQAVILGQQVPR